MNKSIICYLFCLVLLGLVACRKDSDVLISNPKNPIPTVEFEAAVQGVVKDRQGNALADVVVSMGLVNTQTDENGVFTIRDRIQGQRALLNFSKAGYLDLQKAVFASREGMARLFVQLSEKDNASAIQSSSGGEVSINGGGKVTFAANSFEDEQGNPYSGEVRVYSRFIDPSDANVDEVMPGDLNAADAENNIVGLQSFGMAEVQLEGSAGQKLQINQPATMEFPVPNSLLNQAPQQIPLWYYDEADGLWKEEGEASLQGSTYVGQVNHFSFWNCDLPAEVIFLEGLLKDDHNNPLVTKIQIRRPSTGDVRCGPSSQLGYFGGLVPANEVLEMEVLDDCGQVIFTMDIGPFSTNTDIGTVVVNLGSNWTNFTATLNDCNQTAHAGLYLIVQIPGGNENFFFPDSSGFVSGIIPVCQATEVIFTAYDLISKERGTPVTLAVAPQIDAGTITACGVELVNVLAIEFSDGSRYVIPSEFSIGASFFANTPSPGTTTALSFFASDQFSPDEGVIYTGRMILIYSGGVWTDVEPTLDFESFEQLGDDLLNYDMDITGGDLYLSGTNTNDTLMITWNNVTVDELMGTNFVESHLNCNVKLTAIMD